MDEYSTLLEQCRENIGGIPRPFSWWRFLSYEMVPIPSWGFVDDLSLFFWNQTKVIRLAPVVWGHIVQANNTLFDWGFMDAPGEVIFCPDPTQNVHPGELGQIAHRLFLLKSGNEKNKSEQAIGDHLRNEYTRQFGLRVPESISPDIPCVLTTVQFCRRHLPNHRLARGWFPLLINDDFPHIAMVLPSRYWPEPLITNWKQK